MCMISGGTNFHIWHNSELAGWARYFWQNFDLNIIYNRLWINTCSLFSPFTACCYLPGKSNLASWFYLGVDSIEFHDGLFYTHREAAKHKSVSACGFDTFGFSGLQHSVVYQLPYMDVGSTYCHVHNKLYQAPLSRATLKRSGSLGTR